MSSVFGSLKPDIFSWKRTGAIEWLTFATGVFSTMPVVAVPVGSSDISVFRMLFYILIAVLLVKVILRARICFLRNLKLFELSMIAAVLSCVMGKVFLTGYDINFSQTAFSYIPKIAAYIVFALCVENCSADDRKSLYSAFFAGLLFGCLANVVWAIFDAAGFYLFKRSINNVVFKGYIKRHNIRYGTLSLIYSNGLFRAGGFNYDPAHLGFIVPILTGYAVCSKKYWYLLLAVGAIVASASTTALASAMLVILVDLRFIRKKKNNSQKGIFFTLIALAVIVAGVFVFREKVFSMIGRAVSSFNQRISTTYLNVNNLDVRMQYIVLLPKAVINMGPYILLGLGFGTASFSYVTDRSLLSVIGTGNYFAYDMENTYICYLLDTGIIGLVLFLVIIIRLIVFSRRKMVSGNKGLAEQMLYALSVGSFFALFFYHYILFAPFIMAVVFGLAMMDTKPLLESNLIIKIGQVQNEATVIDS